MATYNQGILGGFSGKIGPVIGSNWRDKHVLRSVPTKSKKKPSKAQLQQRHKFAFVLQFINPLKSILSETFGSMVGSSSPFNQALSYYLKEVVIATPTGFKMRYPKALISKGPLCGMAQPDLSTLSPSRLLLQWNNNSDQGFAEPDNTLLALAYAPALDRFEWFLEPALREDAQCVLEFPEAFEVQTVHVWATFTNTSLGISATSSYIGAVVV